MIRRDPHSYGPLAATLFALLALGAGLLDTEPAAAQASLTTDQLAAVQPRQIGPAVTGGRVTDLEALPDDPSTLYVATASGGLWKTTNRGHTWTPLFDDQPVSTFGDVAIAPSNPDVVYAGTGEQNNRQSTSWGNGVYRSDDGGATWRHLGLVETRHIGKIEVHPENPDIVYVAALGNLWAPGEERGVFRSRDGGRTWDKVLYIDENTGAVDLVMNPADPNVLYAATYQRQRRAWGFNGGGPGGGIHKTTDGGESWTELTNGLPSVEIGRIGLAISQSNPSILNALIEAPNPRGAGGGRGGGGFGGRGGPPSATGTYRTEDGGATWEKVSDRNVRPMYYSEIFIDPNDPDLVYTAATDSYKSTDGGRTWTDISAQVVYDVGVHADMHALWIDPSDSEHFYLAGDAGLHETYDGGASYRKINNFPIGQFYAIGVDMRDPYWVYGGMQDNHSWMAPSETRRWAGILNDDWQQIGFGDGMYQQVDKAGPRYVYVSSNGGSWSRLDAITGSTRSIGPDREPGDRFDWTSPGMASEHIEGRFYIGGNRLFISEDFGASWRRTEDLSRQIDRDTLEIMGVPGSEIYISRNDGTSSFGEITTLDESPLDPSILWVGLDDGNIQVSRDQGRTWTEVSRNIQGVRDGTYVSRVLASRRSPGTAYVTLDAHRDGDFAPYVFRTTDFGRSWEPLHAGLPTGSVNVIVEHPDNTNTLFLGTEHHAFASTDGGASWTRIPNLPTTAYDDMVIHPREKDLVLGTHGRSILILDDTRFFAEWTPQNVGAPAHLFSAGRGTLFTYRKDTSYRAQAEFAGVNPRDGVELTYRLGPGSGDARIRITNASGILVRELIVPASEGLHRINWDLRHSDDGEPDQWNSNVREGLARPDPSDGPHVSPGRYTATLVARGVESSTPIEVQADPLLPHSGADYEALERFRLELRDLGLQLAAAMQGMDPGSEQAQQLRQLQQRVRRLDGAWGGGMRGGSLEPPTAADRVEKEAIEREVAALIGG